MLVGVAGLALAFYFSRAGELATLNWLLSTLLPYAVFALIVIFAGEIRQALARLGRRLLRSRTAASEADAYDDIVLAANLFSQNQTGALIVIEREIGLRTYIESGVPLDAHLSYDLLATIFRPSAPLHDGAVIVQKDRIAAAACFLPLSMNPVLSTQLGTRHRAGIGVTEETDAIAVIVSEETGAISLAVGGTIERDLTVEQLRERIGELLRRYVPPSTLPTPMTNGGEELAGVGGRRPEARMPRPAIRGSAGRRALAMKDFFRRHVLHNFGIKLLSLVLAVGLWLAVTRDPVAEVAVEVPIEFRNIPENLEINTESIPRAEIRVRGPQRIVRRLQPADIYAEIELSGMKPGERTFDLTAQQVHQPRELEVVQVIPSQFHLTFDTRLTRQVPVRPRVFGTFAAGYQIGHIDVGPGHDYDQRAAQAGGGGGSRHHRSGGRERHHGPGHFRAACLRF